MCTVGATAVGAPFKVALASYMTASVASYCLRRGILHRWPNGKPLGAAEVLRRHIQYEDEWHMPNKPVLQGRLWHLAHVSAWILLFQPVYPIIEMALYPWDLAAFWFYYPSARGAGLVIESRELRRRGKRGSRAQVFRLDWHRFELNVGKAYPPPNTGRHPPSVLCNLPHVDLPQRSVRHWPWRQHTGRLMRLLPQQPCTPAPSASTTTKTQSSKTLLNEWRGASSLICVCSDMTVLRYSPSLSRACQVPSAISFSKNSLSARMATS